MTRSWTHLTRERMAQILEHNAQAFEGHTAELVKMQGYHEARMRELGVQTRRLDAARAVLDRGFWGRVTWLFLGR